MSICQLRKLTAGCHSLMMMTLLHARHPVCLLYTSKSFRVYRKLDLGKKKYNTEKCSKENCGGKECLQEKSRDNQEGAIRRRRTHRLKEYRAKEQRYSESIIATLKI